MKDRTLLMIPGPIEFEPAVLAAMGAPTTSHIAPDFVEAFGQALERMREVFLCPDGQPFIIAGSGTLAMDVAGANLIEPDDKALVINTGYFGDRFGTLLERYGAKVTHVRAPVGGRPSLETVEEALQRDRFKLMTITHVDTSTGVLANVKGLAALGRRYGALVVVDGVCSVAGEELRMTDWGVDVGLTASQKAVSVPPGLALLVAGPRAMEAFRQRKTPVGNYYADWSHWLPIMQAYEARQPSYFGTPAVNLIWALNVSLGQILGEGIQVRFERHRALGRACQRAIAALGLGQVPLKSEYAAHTMTAPRYPDDITPADLLPRIKEAGAILAGGLHPEIKAEYFRIGHMGPTKLGDLLATVGAIEVGLAACGYEFESGVGVAAAVAAYQA
ncbi:MAG: alanine--glyoxylate aminotransferase family protein [Anaerolineae bacterium]|jgi:alanine-glyoxylate transaminase/serine-glyoxylate transaminase/serine-pyruvate transaminase